METSTKLMYVNVPPQDVRILQELAQQRGWRIKERESGWDQLRRLLPNEEPDITDEEIMAEVRAVRYGEV